jgi:hypothetical protein
LAIGYQGSPLKKKAKGLPNYIKDTAGIQENMLGSKA